MIDSRYREGNFNYNLARLFFRRNNYEQAMQHLRLVDERDLLVHLGTKVLLLKIYYERNEYDALTSLLSSFSVMLNRKKVLSYHKKNYQNIIRFTNRLLHLKPGDQKAYENLKLDIEQAKVLGQREWLLEQLGKKFKK